MPLERSQAQAQVPDQLAEGLGEVDVGPDGPVEQLLRHRADLGPHLAGVGRLDTLGLGDDDAGGWRGGRRFGRLLDDRGEGLGDDGRHGLRIEALLLEVVLERDGGQHLLHHRLEGLHHPHAARRDRGDGLAAPEVQRAVELGPRDQRIEVLLVVLEDEGHLLRDEAVGEEIDLHVLEGREVLPRHGAVAVRDEHHGVGAGQNHASGGVVLHLPGHGVELDLEVVAGDGSEAERQQVEEQRPVLRRVEGDQAVRPVGVGDPVDLLEVGGLPGLRRPVVDHLRFDGPLAEVELDHGRASATIARPARGRGGP